MKNNDHHIVRMVWQLGNALVKYCNQGLHPDNLTKRILYQYRGSADGNPEKIQN